MRRDRFVFVAALGISVVLACARRPEPAPEPPPPPPDTIEVSVWPETFDSARAALAARQYHEAERILSTYALEHPDTPEAQETDFWRALILTDPENPEATPKGAITALDAYLARGAFAPMYAPARVLKRLTEIGDSLRTVIGVTRMTAETRDKTQAEEIQRLRDSLEATKAELERVRRRVTGRIPDAQPR